MFRGQTILMLGLVGLSWLSWSAFTFNLFSITIHYIHNHIEITQNGPVLPSPSPAKSEKPGPVIKPHVEDAPEVEQQHVVRGTDVVGKGATFLISLLSDEYRWVIGSTSELEAPHPYLEFSREMRQNINNAREVICVGGSSEEMRPGLSEEQGRLMEEDRAARRADSIAIWVKKILTNPMIPVRKLNVGHHKPERGSGNSVIDTSDQRRVIIVLVLDEDEKVDMDQALRDAFEKESNKHPIYRTILDRYSLTRGEKFKWAN